MKLTKSELRQIIKEEIKSLNEDIEPSETMYAFARIGNSKRPNKVDGQRVDVSTAVSAWKIWDMANDSLKKRLNNMNGKELYNAIQKMRRNA